MISAESGAPLGISISKRPPEAREAIDTGAGGKAKIIGCDGCSGWAQGQIRRTINRKWWRRDSRVNPREKPQHLGRADEKLNPRHSLPLCVENHIVPAKKREKQHRAGFDGAKADPQPVKRKLAELVVCRWRRESTWAGFTSSSQKNLRLILQSPIKRTRNNNYCTRKKKKNANIHVTWFHNAARSRKKWKKIQMKWKSNRVPGDQPAEKS